MTCGGAGVVAAPAVLGGVPPRTVSAVLAVVVAAWSLRASVVASLLLGGMAWLFLTAFDVNADGGPRRTPCRAAATDPAHQSEETEKWLTWHSSC